MGSQLTPRSDVLAYSLYVVRKWMAAAASAALVSACAGQPVNAGQLVTVPGESGQVAGGVTTYGEPDRPGISTVTGMSLTGKRLSTTPSRGTVAVINAWASWCGPCRTELPTLARAATSHASSVTFIGLLERDDPANAAALATEIGLPYDSILDQDGQMLGSLRLLPVAAIPSTLVLDKHGRVAVRIIGPVTGEELDATLRQLVAEQ